MEPAPTALRAKSVEERRLRAQGHHREAAGHQQRGALLRGEVARRATP